MPQLSIAFLTFEHAVYLKRPFVPIVEENPQGDFLFECIHNTSLHFFGIINIAMRSTSVYLANVGIVLQHIIYILYRYWSISNAERENVENAVLTESIIKIFTNISNLLQNMNKMYKFNLICIRYCVHKLLYVGKKCRKSSK